jgi:hypothetical protein
VFALSGRFFNELFNVAKLSDLPDFIMVQVPFGFVMLAFFAEREFGEYFATVVFPVNCVFVCQKSEIVVKTLYFSGIAQNF